MTVMDDARVILEVLLFKFRVGIVVVVIGLAAQERLDN